jgi:diamine N-acetyltransferase
MADLRVAELTPDNLRAAVGLTLKPGQEKFVMANFDPDNELEPFRCGIWRLNVAADAQGRGVGRFAVDTVAAEGRRRGRSRITVLWEKGTDGPEDFYLRLGFVPTGELFGEVVGVKDITAP